MNKDLPWGSRISIIQKPVVLDEILIMVSILNERDDLLPEGRGVWTGTVALPIRNAGVLELGLWFAPLN